MKLFTVALAMWEPGHEEMGSTAEKDDVHVDNATPASFYRIDVQPFSVRSRVSVCCVCRYMVRPSEAPLTLDMR